MNIIEKNYKWAKPLSKRNSTDLLILHHAAAASCTAEDVHRWHVGNGWAGIGYHYLVRKDGTIYRGRPEDTVGAHAYGANSHSIGVCFEGNYQVEPTMPAGDALWDNATALMHIKTSANLAMEYFLFALM